MANFYLVGNSRFNPFSYQELLQPALMATQAHQDIESQYAELATKANIWDEMANEQTDPYAYKMYKTYSNDLERQAEQLAKEGLNPSSRQNMLRMRQRYSSDIVPIEQAYKRRQELIDEQRKLLAQDNTLMFDRDASMMSLDDLIKNPQLTYKSYSGATLAKQVGTAAQNLVKKMRSNPRKWNSILNGQYFETMMQKGYTPEEIILSVSGNPNAPKELRDIVEDAINSSNIKSWKDQDTLNRAYRYARLGLWSAVGETQYQTVQNQDYMNPLQRLQYSNALKQREEEINKYRANPLPLRSSQEISKGNNEINDFIKKGYLIDTKNGLILSERGKAELRAANFKPLTISWETYKKQNPKAPKLSYDAMVAEVEKMGSRPNAFSSWYNKNIGGYNKYTNQAENSTSRLNNYRNSLNEGSYDIYRTTEYDRQLDATYGKEVMTQLWSNAGTEDGTKVLYGVEFNGKDGWTKTKSYSKKDLAGYRVTNMRPSKFGSTAILQSDDDDKNDIIRIKVPAGINLGAEENLNSAIYNINHFEGILNTGKQPVLDNNGNIATDLNGNVIYTNNPLTDADKLVFKGKKDKALQDIYAFSSQIVVPSQTSNEQIKPWY